MHLTTLQWNIGGAYVRTPNSDAAKDESYTRVDLDYIIECIRRYNPDIVTLQETHTDNTFSQAQHLSTALGFPHYVNDIYNQSHLDPTQQMGQALLSRFPLTDHTFEFFVNPKYTFTHPSGQLWVSHNKGVTRCALDLPDNQVLDIRTTHLIPFHRFHVDPMRSADEHLRHDMETKLQSDAPHFLLQGDFNFDEPQTLLPQVFTAGTQEVPLPHGTTPEDRKNDHVIFRGMQLVRSEIISTVLTDHYPIVSEFSVD